jgi:hypothetical protein
MRQMFAFEDTDDPTVVHPDLVRVLGDGNIGAGRRVLEKFIRQVRQRGAPHG